jgi:hypothetical protein
MLAQSWVAMRKGRGKLSSFYAWIIRAMLCLGAVAFRHAVDTPAIAIWSAAVLAFAFGFWEASREKKPEDLSRTMFPD